jgi:uncharacterized protein with HEPN domain
MSRHESRLPDYLEHMAEAVGRVMEYTRGKSQQEFLSDRLLQDAVMRNLGVLGEAANNCFKVSPNVALRFPNLPFAKIYELRNQLTHGYTTVDMAIVWNIVERDIPELRTEIAAVLVSLQNRSEPA